MSNSGSTRWVPALPADDVPPKKVVCMEVAGVPLAFCRVKEEVFAVRNLCSHAAATFDGGRMRAFRIMCPLHGGTFDVRTGEAIGAPAKLPIDTYAVRQLASGMLEVQLPDETS